MRRPRRRSTKRIAQEQLCFEAKRVVSFDWLVGWSSLHVCRSKRRKNKQIMANRTVTLADKAQGEEYAVVEKTLGNLRFRCKLENGTKVIGVLCGAMIRKVWVSPADVVAVAKRDDGDQVDIVRRYKRKEVQQMLLRGHITFELIAQQEEVEGRKSSTSAYGESSGSRNPSRATTTMPREDADEGTN